MALSFRTGQLGGAGLCLVFVVLLAQPLTSGSLPFQRLTVSPPAPGEAPSTRTQAPEKVQSSVSQARRAGDGGQTGEAVGSVTVASLHRARGFMTRAFSGIEASAPEWAAANGVTPSLSFSHNLARIFPPTLYDEHPEFFPLVSGKRFRPGDGLARWNPDLGRSDVAAFAAEAARAYFAEHPDKPSFSVGVNDALLFGESAEMLKAVTPLKWFRERPDFSNLVFRFTNRVAERVTGLSVEGDRLSETKYRLSDGGDGVRGEVREDGRTYPNKYIGALAYYWAENAPDFPLHPNVVPFLTADRSQGYDPAFRLEEALLQRRWAARSRARFGVSGFGSGVGNPEVQASGSGPLREQREDRDDRSLPSRAGLHRGSRLGLYDYLYGNGFLIPRLHTRLLAENLRQAHRAGFTDYYAEMSPNWGLDGPQPWLVAQLLQDPEQSPEVLLDEYYRSNFGPAAVPMRRFFERCERQWMNQAGPAYWLKHFRNESQASLFPSSVGRELRGLLTEAERVADDDATRAHVKLVSDAFGVTERFVAMQEARVQLNRLSLGEGRARPLGAPRQSKKVDGNSGGPSGPALPGSCGALLEAAIDFVKARDELTNYTNRLRETSPFAVAAFQWEDYLRHDPVANALIRLRAAAQAEGEMDQANTAIASAGSPDLSEAWALCVEAERLRGISLVRNGGFAGDVRPARRIAGLDYGVALPEGWESSVEPVEFQRATLHPETEEGTSHVSDRKPQRAPKEAARGRDASPRHPGSTSEVITQSGRRGEPSLPFSPPSQLVSPPVRVLRLVGNKETSVYQWATPKPERVHVASVQVRGHVSSGTVVSLTFGFLDGQQQRQELKTLRLPEGDWPEWVTLRLIERSPAGARWVGIGVRVQNQVAGDWAEVKEFELAAH